MIIAIFVVMFNIFLLIFPQIVLTASRDGLMLWFNNVLPSLLPFMIAANMLISLGFAEFIGDVLSPVMRKIFRLPGAAGFGLVIGLTSGYPMGAKTVADLTQKNKLSTKEAQHLLAFCNNAGPLFIVGVVGVGMFGSARIGYFLWISHVLAALTMGFLLRGPKQSFGIPVRNAYSKYRENRLANIHSIGKILGDAVKNAMESMAIIGGLIIFFSVVVAILETLVLPSSTILGGFFAGIIEVTGGARKLSAMPLDLFTLASVAFVIAFGGLSVLAQSFHFISATKINSRKFFLAKILHGVLAAVFTVFLANLL
ncbi:MAG: hypothetical protein FWF81_06870 [Defluviitaleaceae bacterium]|nr:hypothetical protein [Defluviitaleaceae bacterium]